jgi:hypothetical protein
VHQAPPAAVRGGVALLRTDASVFLGPLREEVRRLGGSLVLLRAPPGLK